MLWELSFTDWIMSLAFFSGITFLTGYFIDRILLTAGFGAIGNWLLILGGVYAGLYGLNMYGYELHWYPVITLSAAAGAATLSLVTMCLLKRMF